MLANLGQDDVPPILKSIVRDGTLYYILILSELILTPLYPAVSLTQNVAITVVNFFVLLFARVRAGSPIITPYLTVGNTAYLTQFPSLVSSTAHSSRL
jgi:hypothetical protein